VHISDESQSRLCRKATLTRLQFRKTPHQGEVLSRCAGGDTLGEIDYFQLEKVVAIRKQRMEYYYYYPVAAA